MQGGGQNAGDRAQPAVQCQLSQGRIFAQFLLGQHTHFAEQAKGDGQVEMAAFLEEIRRRQVDGDALGRQRQPEGAEGRAHPFAALRHRFVRQADHGKGGQARGHLDLDVHVHHLDALEGDRMHSRDQDFPRKTSSRRNLS